MEAYKSYCPDCKSTYFWQRFIGKTPQQLQQMKNDQCICRKCGSHNLQTTLDFESEVGQEYNKSAKFLTNILTNNKTNDVNNLLNQVRESIQLQLRDFVGKKFTTQIIDEIVAKLIGENPNISIEATVDKSDSTLIHLVPKNIFTALVLDGIHVPYELVKDVNEYETTLKKYFLKDGYVFTIDKDNFKINL